MKYRGIIACILMPVILILSSCSVSKTAKNETVPSPSPKPSGQIYLYGEEHGVDKILEKEFEIWSRYYHEEGMRHLFVELPYYAAEFLNIWMKENNDDILDQLFKDWEGTSVCKTSVKDFYKKIKSECPETVFHGTDVGHQYKTTGIRYLRYLEENGLQDTEKYTLTVEATKQGKYYYENEDIKYREDKMVENFIREFEKLGGESIMGIYGSAHTDINGIAVGTDSVPCMANQLEKRYGDALHTEDLSWMAKDIEPLRKEIITVNGKDYEASYFGRKEITWSDKYIQREFWRLENAYDDFKNMKKTGDILPYDNYPMLIEEGQVFVIDYTRKDGSVERKYYRSDGYIWNNRPSTEEFVIPQRFKVNFN